MVWTYFIIAVLLLAAELLYFKIADRCNIIDKPNQRSSHTSIVLRGGGIIFAISILVWLVLQMVLAHWIYLIVVGVLLVGAYVLFMKKYYNLHEEYLDSLK